ncbi:unnamed protein product [Candida verbasci]|uniref:Cytochrome c oxidase assembly factor 1 n=1 Tax=Candida verbasci TaxID=1227364 RepID=A0A9W4U0E3_9ASCO|nr:unnamed protein product [Candida verbasci]
MFKNITKPLRRLYTTRVTNLKYQPPITIDKELPDPSHKKKINRRYFLVYGLGITLSCLIIFNYEKTQSPIVTSTLFYLRRNKQVENLLGSGIDFAYSWPWISGKLNTVQGLIDIKFKIKGNKNDGYLKLKANRESKLHPFNVENFSIEIDGKDYDLTKDSDFDFDL